jgi:hypothetical protein
MVYGLGLIVKSKLLGFDEIEMVDRIETSLHVKYRFRGYTTWHLIEGIAVNIEL